MKNIGLALVAIALIFNLTLASMGGLRIGDDSLFSEEQEREESFENSNITTALAPPLRHRDFITYDSRIYGIWYGENTTTGEYDQIEIIADGETTERISDIEGKLDGFFRLHDCVSKEVFTVGTITLSYTNETGDSITLTGTMDMQRKEHWDIVAVKPIAITNYANITIDGLGSLIGADNMGGADQMFFGGKIRSWPMLEEEYIPNLDEELYSQGQELEVGTMGIVQQPSEQIAEWMVPYDWEVEQGLIIHGYDTVKINVTSNMFDYLFYQKELWISSDMSFPVRVKDVINTSYESEDSTYYQYMTMENERTLKDSGSYKQGSTEVVWKGTLGEPAPQGHFLLQSPLAEFQPWYDNMMPVGGSNFEDSSFDISPEEAIEFAMNNSQVLQDFAANYSDATLDWGNYNATKDALDPEGKAGVYYWNLSIGHEPTDEERAEAYEQYEETGEYYAPWKCRITVKKVVERATLDNNFDPTTVMSIDYEYLYNQSSISTNKYHYPDNILTMTSSENIMKQDSETYERCFEDDELIWNTFNEAIPNEEYIQYGVSTGDAGEGGQLMDIFSMVIGLSAPTFDFTWSHLKGWVGQDGKEYSVNVDAENGQMVATMYMEGTDFMKFLQ